MTAGTVQGFHLSGQQKRMWQLQREGKVRQIQCVLEMEGVLDRQRLEAAVKGAARRHEVLRTEFVSLPGMNLPLQVIAERERVEFRVGEREGWKKEDERDAVERLMGEEREGWVEGAEGTLARFCLAPVSRDRHFLVVTLLALVADREALVRLSREIVREYEGRGAEEREDPTQYVDFSEWQAGMLSSKEGEEGREFWSRQIEESTPLPLLPGEADALPGEVDGERGAVVVGVLDGETVERLQAVARAQETGMDVLLLTGWHILLGRLTGESRVTVHCWYDGRRLEQLQNALGLFEHYLPVSFDCNEDITLASALRNAAKRFKVGRLMQDSFSWDGAPGGAGDSLVAFRWQPWPQAEVGEQLRCVMAQCVAPEHGARLTLACTLLEEGTIQIGLEYDRRRWDKEGLERLGKELSALLGSMEGGEGVRISELPLMAEEERRRLIVEWNATGAAYPLEVAWPELFEEQVARTPGAEALKAGQERLSFVELNVRANRLAHYLQQRQVRAETPVVVCLERSAELIIGLLGVAKAGGAYVVIEPGHPVERIARVLEDSRPGVIVTRSKWVGWFAGSKAEVVCIDAEKESIAAAPADNPRRQISGSSLAYILYTSGSTGRPKGVMIEHRSLTNLAWALRQVVYGGVERAMKVGLNASLAFDGSVKQLIQMVWGHSLHLVSEEQRGSPRDLMEYVAEEKLEVLDCTPSVLRLLLAEGMCKPGGWKPRLVLVGGEAVTEGDWQMLRETEGTEFVNVYGPTECTVDVLSCGVGSWAKVSLGQPLPNVRVYVVDRNMQPVPVGMAGELYVGGIGVGRGYCNEGGQTGERFVPDPFGEEAGGRLYRTGDRVRWEKSGRLSYEGRMDRQVKIRGYRIELGEIESVLVEHPGVRQAVALVNEDRVGDPRLVAYVVPGRRQRVEGVAYRLANGLEIAHQNKNETDYLYREIFEQEIYVRHGIFLREDAVVFDVGANIGMFTLFAGERCSQGRIYAFEPIGPIYENLQRNAVLCPARVKLFPMGLGESEKTASFTYYARYSMMSGQSEYADSRGEEEVIKRYLRNDEESGSKAATALLSEADELLAGRFQAQICEGRLRRLSDVIEEEKVERIDLLKIDVQRAEMDVLRGIDAGDWVRIRQIVMEVHDGESGPTRGRVEEIGELLKQQGFTVWSEQDKLLRGTDRFNLYAVRGGEEGREEPLQDGRETGNGAGPRKMRRISEAELRAHVQERLPEYMVPGVITVLEQLPLTVSGKVDFRALPAPEYGSQGMKKKYARTPVEEIVAGIWSELLKLEGVGREESFFELGGHSLLATQVISRMRAVFGVELPLRVLFEGPTVAGLAGKVEQALREGEKTAIPAMTRVSREIPLPLSFAQQRLWFIDQLEPGSTAYNSPAAVRLRGRLEPGMIERSLTEIVRRHEVLRTSFPVVEGQPVQRIAPPCPVTLPVIDVSGMEQPEAAARALSAEEADCRFNLAAGALLRCSLVRLGAEDHLLLLTLHHVVSDGWSMNILVKEFTALYEAFLQGRPSPLPELTLQYADFAHWQRHWLSGSVLDSQISFWRDQLSGASVTELPTDYQRPISPSGRGARLSVVVPPELAERLLELSRRQGTTLFMTLLASFQFLLGRYCGQDDVVVGTSIANRHLLEIEPLIGFFVNMLALRAQLRPECSFNGLLAQVRHTLLDAYAHQDMPYDHLVQVLASERAQERRQLFEAVLTLQNNPEEPLHLTDLDLSPWESGHSSTQFDVMLSLATCEGGLVGTLVYAAELFAPDRMEWFASAFISVLEQVATEPQARLFEISLLSKAERQQILTKSHQPRGPLPLLCVHEMFEMQARRQPEAVAVRSGEVELSYSDLNRRANQLAHYLKDIGVGPEVPVGLCLERSPELIVALFAILKAGGAYVPLDAGYPAERLAYMVKDSCIPVLLTTEHLRDRLMLFCPLIISIDSERNVIAAQKDHDLTVDISLDSLAYIIYTSGSSGLPKGAMVTHRGLSNYVEWAITAYDCLQGTGSPVHSSLSFDLTVTSIFPALIVGRTVTLLNEESAIEDLSCKLASGEPFSLVKLTPSHLRLLRQLSHSDGGTSRARLLVIGGEVLHYEDVGFWRQNSPATKLVNEYGPSETVVGSCIYELEEASEQEGPVPIGRPISNTSLYVLDHWHTLCPPGVRGELFIGGSGLARGYLSQPAMTAAKFVPDSYSGEIGSRLYRTGDLARRRTDGNLEFLGRLDDQVKIRGYRVEPQEVEAVLKGHSLVRDATVLASNDSDGRVRLVAYVVPHKETIVMDRELQVYLQARLPEYMMPAVITMLEDMPLTVNGKVDHKLLPFPQWSSNVSRVNAARTMVEHRLMDIWREVLSLDRVGLEDNFFQCGGHSLLGVRLITRIHSVFGVELPLRTIFDQPTIIAQAALLEGMPVSRNSGPLVALQKSGSRRPLFCVHPFFGLAHCYQGLAEMLGVDQPFYGLQSQGLEQGETPIFTIPDMAADYLKAIRLVQPSGPYQLAGWSLGSIIAFEMAQQLVGAGETVSFLGLFEGRPRSVATTAHHRKPPADRETLVSNRETEVLVELAVNDLELSEKEARQLSPEQRIARYLDGIKSTDQIAATFSHEQLRRLLRVSVVNLLALESYELKAYPGDVVLFRIPVSKNQDESYGWSRFVLGHIQIHEFPGKHSEFMSGPSIALMAEKVTQYLQS